MKTRLAMIRPQHRQPQRLQLKKQLTARTKKLRAKKLRTKRRRRISRAKPAAKPPVIPQTVVVAEDSWKFPPLAQQGDNRTWIKLTSGEWLRGDLEVYRQKMLQFDSIRASNRSIKEKYIVELYSPTAVDVVFDDGTILVGPMHLTRDTITVQTIEGESKSHTRKCTPSPRMVTPARWSGHINLGFATRQGNTNSVDFTSDILVRWRSPHYRFVTTYIGAISETEEIETANNHRANAEFSYFFNRFWYYTPIIGTVFNDRFQNIRLQALVATGLGYIPIFEDDIALDLFRPGFS